MFRASEIGLLEVWFSEKEKERLAGWSGNAEAQPLKPTALPLPGTRPSRSGEGLIVSPKFTATEKAQHNWSGCTLIIIL
jgi:hypothetical protein